MSTYQCKGLFGRLPDPTEQGVDELLMPLYPLLWQTVHLPWQQYLAYRASDPEFLHYSPGEVAQFIRPRIAHRAAVLFDGHPDVIVPPRHKWPKGMFYIQVKDEILVTPKKLMVRRDLMGRRIMTRSNYPTSHNLDWWQQRREEGVPDLPRVILGYLPVNEFTEIRVIIGHPRRRDMSMHWWFFMPDQSQALLRIAASQQDISVPDDQEPEFLVKPRKEARKRDRK